MTRHANERTSVSALLGARVIASDGSAFGEIREFAVVPSEDASHVFGFVLRGGTSKKEAPTLVRIMDLVNQQKGLTLRSKAEILDMPDAEAYLLLERDLLDQQIIDVYGHKVVRVNDVDLIWEACLDGTDRLSLRIAEVEVGLRGAVRRLLKGLPQASVESLATRLPPSVIPWDFVDLIERDPSRRVKLKIEQNRLANMHPSDIADILEELAPAERQALFTSLDEEVAAEALEEVGPKMQQALIQDLDSEVVAGIVEEMDPGAAADFLAELPEERSDAILEEMDPEERQEVEELLEFSGDSAAGRMTTEYIALPPEASVSFAIQSLHEFEGDLEAVTDIILIDDAGAIKGLVPIVQLVLAKPSAILSSLPQGHIVTCRLDASGKKVAELFDKYNLRSLSVIDDEHHLAGVIHAEQVIANLRHKH
jgi:CBS domain-containing protein/sporulation protein YlmC with PRC-barrel domain